MQTSFKTGLNPLIIREELQPTDEQIGVILARLNPLIIREELQPTAINGMMVGMVLIP